MDRELEYADEYHELYMLGLLDGQEDIAKIESDKELYKMKYQQLKKQKDDLVEYIKENEKEYGSLLDNEKIILRMLGEEDV